MKISEIAKYLVIQSLFSHNVAVEPAQQTSTPVQQSLQCSLGLSFIISLEYQVNKRQEYQVNKRLEYQVNKRLEYQVNKRL